jgi:hypothetical protein
MKVEKVVAKIQGWLVPFALGVWVVFTLAVLRFTRHNAYFYANDFSDFWLAKTGTLPWSLATPAGGQVVPLYRALTFAMYRIAPMGYGAALTVTCVFHALGVAFLYRTLEFSKHTRVNAVLAAYYGTYVFLGLDVDWVSAGLTSVAYIALALMTVYYYLRFCRCRKPKDLVAVCVCAVTALGFSAKAILVPLCCVGAHLSLGLRREEEHRGRPGLEWAVAGALVGAGVGYVVLARSLVTEEARALNLSPAFQLRFLISSWRVLANSLLDRVVEFGTYDSSSLVPAFWIGVVAYTVIRERSSIVPWLVGMALVSLNILMIGMSNRTLHWRELIVFEYRYYCELCFLVVLFAGLALHRLRGDTPEARWLATSWRRPVVGASIAALLSIHAFRAYRGFAYISPKYEPDMARSRLYIDNLRSDFSRLLSSARSQPVFVDGWIPGYVNPLDFTLRRHSQIFLLFGFAATFQSEAKASFLVSESGHVVAVRHAPARPLPVTSKRPGAAVPPLWMCASSSATLYLLGTVPLASRDFYPLPDNVERAFDASDVLLLDRAVDRSTRRAVDERLPALAAYAPHDALDFHLSAPTRARLYEYAGRFGESPENNRRADLWFEGKRPWFVASVVLAAELQQTGYTPEFDIGRYFYDKASASHKKVKVLDSPADELAFFRGLSAKAQDLFLRDVLDRTAGRAAAASEAVKAWSAGDVIALDRLLLSRLRSPELAPMFGALYAGPNEKATTKLEALLNTRATYFVVLDAARLVGHGGIVDLLLEKKHAVERR